MFLKICGITRHEDAFQAVEQGATAVGFVFWPQSPRHITPARAAAIVARLPRGVMGVGVFVNESVETMRNIVEEAGLTTVQLHGSESPDVAGALGVPILRAVTVDDAELVAAAWGTDTTFLLDAIDPVRRGGTGARVNWTEAARIARGLRVVLAGGLTPENVADAVGTVRPFGVDVSSGVESAPGIKDGGKMARFLENAREAFARRTGAA